MADIENKKYDKNYKEGLAIALLYILLIPLVIAIIYDHILYGTLNCTIELLSIDSILSITSIIASIVFAFLTTRTNSEYKFDSDDHKQLKIISTRFYIHLLVVSIVLILLDIICYLYNFRISVATSLGIETLYLLIFLVPISISFAQEKRHFFALARTRISQLKYKSESNEKLYEQFFPDVVESNLPSSILNKFINRIVLKQGFDDTLKGLTEGISLVYSKIYIPEKEETYIYLIYLQELYTKSFLDGTNKNVNLNESTIRKYISNLSSICSSPLLENISDVEIKKKIIEKLTDTFNNLQKIIEQSDYSNLLTTNFYRITSDLLVKIFANYSYKSTIDPGKSLYVKLTNYNSFVFAIVNSICFSSLVSEHNPWYLNALSYTIGEFPHIVEINDFYCYLIFILLYIVNLLNRSEFTSSKKDSKGIKETFEKRFSNYIVVLLDNITPEVYLTISTFICNFNSSVKNLYISKSGENNVSDLVFKSALDDAAKSGEYVLLTHFFKHRNHVDPYINDLGFCANNLFAVANTLRDTECYSIIDFYTKLVDLSICRVKDDFDNKIKKLIEYVLQYHSRALAIDSIYKKIKPMSFIKKMNSSFSKLKGFDSNYKEDPDNKIAKPDFVLLVENDKPMELTRNNTFCNPKHVLRRLFASQTDVYKEVKKIQEYSDEVINDIISFEPSFKCAPNFDKTFKESTNDKIQKLVNMNNGFDYLFPENKYDVFLKSNPVRFYIKLLSVSNVRLILPEDLEKPDLLQYEKSYNYALDNLNLSKNAEKQTIYQEIAKKYVLVTLNFEYCIMKYPSGRRLIYEKYSKMKLDDYVTTI